MFTVENFDFPHSNGFDDFDLSDSFGDFGGIIVPDFDSVDDAATATESITSDVGANCGGVDGGSTLVDSCKSSSLRRLCSSSRRRVRGDSSASTAVTADPLP